MGPFNAQSLIDQQLFGALQSPQGVQGMPQQPQQAPQEQTGVNRILNSPGLANALGRMGSAILIANSKGAGLAGSFGYGASAFQDEMAAQEDITRKTDQQRVQNTFDAVQVQSQAQKLARQQKYGIESGGFEGDMARALYILQDPASTPQEKAQANAVVQTAERMQGSWDPVSGDYRWNQRSQLPVGGTQPQVQAEELPLQGEGDLQSVVMGMESGGRRYGPDGGLLTSPKGAQGEMQVMPATARDPGFGVMPARDNSPTELARVGRDYLAAMSKRYGDPAKAMAAYNGGPGRLDRTVAANGESYQQALPQETQNYIRNGMARLALPQTGNRKVDAALMQQAGTALVDRSAAQPKAQSSYVAAAAKTDNVLATIDKAIGQTGGWTAGAGSMLGMVPGTPARDLEATLTTIRANIGFDALQEMRNNSPTGGALGSVTDAEGKKLDALKANVENSQSPEQLKENLTKLRQQTISSWQRIREAYKQDYGVYPEGGDLANASAAAPTVAAPSFDRSAIEAELKRRGVSL